jgi:hypothetical protein
VVTIIVQAIHYCTCIFFVRGLFANKKSFLFAKRPSGGVWENFWDLPPVGWAGGTHFSKISKITSFFEFNFFFNPFLKKIERRGGACAARALERGRGSHEEARAEFFLGKQEGDAPIVLCIKKIKGRVQ